MAIPTPVQSRECAFVSAQVCVEGIAEAEAAARLAADKILALVADIRTIPYVTVSTTRSAHCDDNAARVFSDAVAANLRERVCNPVCDALMKLRAICSLRGWHRDADGFPIVYSDGVPYAPPAPATCTHPANPVMIDRLAESSTPAELVVLLRSAQAERDRLVAENINLEAQLARATNALHAAE